MPAYTLWIILFLIIPVLGIGIARFTLLKAYWRIYLATLGGAFLVSVCWDAISYGKRIWYFPETSTLDIAFVGIPLEEYVFLILMSVLFTSITILFSIHNQTKV